jgi:hypothetical protein
MEPMHFVMDHGERVFIDPLSSHTTYRWVTESGPTSLQASAGDEGVPSIYTHSKEMELTLFRKRHRDGSMFPRPDQKSISRFMVHDPAKTHTLSVPGTDLHTYNDMLQDEESWDWWTWEWYAFQLNPAEPVHDPCLARQDAMVCWCVEETLPNRTRLSPVIRSSLLVNTSLPFLSTTRYSLTSTFVNPQTGSAPQKIPVLTFRTPAHPSHCEVS